MNVTHYIGFDVHKKSISYCAKMAGLTSFAPAALFACRFQLPLRLVLLKHALVTSRLCQFGRKLLYRPAGAYTHF